MKKKFKQTSKKYIVVPIAAIGLIAILAVSKADKVSARGFSNNGVNLAQRLAEKFNLDQQQVEETMNEFHQEKFEARDQEMHDRFENKLQKSADEGKITDAQMYDILEKFEEMHDRIEELRDEDLSSEDMHEAMADIHEEMQAWAEEQGIDFESFMRVGVRQMHGKHHII